MRRPRFIAEQARNAKGLLGRIIAAIMARETWGQNRRAIDALAVEECDHILDVGCGHGRSLAVLAALAPKGRVVGSDPSELMAEIAVWRNRKLIRAHRVDVAVAAADALPFADAVFDKAVCVHVVYFWADLRAALCEIARVLKPGGRFALVFSTNANEAAVQAFPGDIYRFPALAEMVAALEAAGFTVDLPSDTATRQRSGPILLVIEKPGEPLQSLELEIAGAKA
jgi:ubiquinone/menaquinone biosynthesis C-methylase UbiE